MCLEAGQDLLYRRLGLTTHCERTRRCVLPFTLLANEFNRFITVIKPLPDSPSQIYDLAVWRKLVRPVLKRHTEKS